MAEYHSGPDWDELGRSIEDIVDRAVNSQDFQKLNQTITQAMEKAVDLGNESLRKAREYQDAAYRKKHGYGRPVYTYTPSKPEVREKRKLPALYGSPAGQTTGGILKTIGGSLLTLGGSVGVLASTVAGLVMETGILTLATGVLAGVLGVGVALLGSGIGSLNRVARFKTYRKVLGERTHCKLDRLAQSVGKSAGYVRKDVQKMIDKGLFLEGHLDGVSDSLITSDETYHHYQQARLQMEQQKQQALLEKQRQEMEETAKKTNPELREVLQRGENFLREIHRCNDLIPGEEISDKISRMELIVKKIFERAEAHPEIVPDLKKLMDYYLPMTVKLLNAYADMDRQPIQGETIQASKREIEATLDTLNTAFEKLLDSVFRDTAMDVSSDISVLQTLLAQEGLTEDDFGKMRKQQDIM